MLKSILRILVYVDNTEDKISRNTKELLNCRLAERVASMGNSQLCRKWLKFKLPASLIFCFISTWLSW